MVTAAKPAAATAGAIHVAATTATLPTTAQGTLATDFKDLGYISDAGVTRTLSMESTDIKDWGGTTVLSIGTGKTEQFKFALIEADKLEAMKLVYTAASESSGDISASQGADNRTAHAFVIDMVLEGNKIQRIVIPNGKVASISDIVYVNNAAVSFELTVTAMADASGNTSYDYIHTNPTSGSGSPS